MFRLGCAAIVLGRSRTSHVDPLGKRASHGGYQEKVNTTSFRRSYDIVWTLIQRRLDVHTTSFGRSYNVVWTFIQHRLDVHMTLFGCQHRCLDVYTTLFGRLYNVVWTLTTLSPRRKDVVCNAGWLGVLNGRWVKGLKLTGCTRIF